MIKKLLLTSTLFLLVLLASSSNTYAQGAYTCKVKFNNCTIDQSKCDTGYSLPEKACFMAPAFTTNAKCQALGAPCVIDDSQTTSEAEIQAVNCNTVGGGLGIDTAIGCIPFDSQDSFLGFFISWAIGIGGGIAFLLILLAGFQITTSSGNPERLKAGQELLTSAISGLIMLIFSVFILRVIGVDVLKLNDFGFGK